MMGKGGAPTPKLPDEDKQGPSERLNAPTDLSEAQEEALRPLAERLLAASLFPLFFRLSAAALLAPRANASHLRGSRGEQNA